MNKADDVISTKGRNLKFVYTPKTQATFGVQDSKVALLLRNNKKSHGSKGGGKRR
jgi:hypothetical protein